MLEKEALTRIIIDKMLAESEWQLLDDETKRKNVICEATIRSERGTKNSDYLLLDNYNKPIAIVEAKAPHKNPLSAKTQAKNYAVDIGARFVYLENAFVEAFNMLCTNNKEIVEEFLVNIEQALSSKDTKKQIKKLSDLIFTTESKLGKLVDLHIDGSIDKSTYEGKYSVLADELTKLKDELFELENNMDEENAIKVRVSAFRKIFESNKPLENFDPDVFETVIEEVVLGGTEGNGEHNPYILTFIFKTGLTSNIDCSKKPKAKNNNSCSYQEHNSCGVRGFDV